MSKTETIVKVIVFVMIGVFATAGVKQLIKEMDAHDTEVKKKQSTETRAEIYIPVPKNDRSRGYYVCSKYMETQITSPHFECFGSLYSCNGMPVVKCADGTAYFNPTDLKLDGAQLFNHNQIFPMR
jgi:hypothetical protein